MRSPLLLFKFYSKSITTISGIHKNRIGNLLVPIPVVTYIFLLFSSKYPQAYFKNPDKKVRNTRIGTAVGAYAALSVGGRYLQGGTLTTDQYGRKDIAGIPFL